MKTSHTKLIAVACAAWAPRLAALHPDDLTPDSRAALRDHLAGCPSCAAVYAAYQEIDTHILSLPAVQPSAQQMTQLQTMISTRAQNDLHWKPAARVQEWPARALTRQAGLGRQVRSLAAVLLVMVLAASAFALFSSRHLSRAGSGASGTLYAVSYSGTAYAVDASSGTILWSTPLHIKASEQFVVAEGTIFVGSSDDDLYALKASTGQLLWKRSYKDLTTVNNQTVEIAPYPASDGTAIYFGTPKGIYAWSASDGAQLWSYAAPVTCSALSGICAPEVATVSNGTVYAYLDGLYALNAVDGSLQWSNAGVPSDTPLVVVHNQIYVASYGRGAMAALSAATGQLLNTPNLPRVNPLEMITDGQTVYLRAASSGTSEIYAVQSSDNAVLWHEPNADSLLLLQGMGDGHLYYTYGIPAAAIHSPPLTPVTIPASITAPANATAVVFAEATSPATSPERFCAVSTADGSAEWCRQLPYSILPELAVASQGTLYITTSGGLEARSLGNDTVLWTALQGVALAHVELSA